MDLFQNGDISVVVSNKETLTLYRNPCLASLDTTQMIQKTTLVVGSIHLAVVL